MHLVPPAEKPEPRKRPAAKFKTATPMLECHRCKGHEFIVTTIGARLEGRKLKGGTDQIVCATCMLLGQRVVIA